MDLYYFSDLDHFLRVETKSEKWHLEHPGRLSRKYDEVPVEKINGMDVYVFGYSVDVANDLLIMKPVFWLAKFKMVLFTCTQVNGT